jgi:hypothetical protein
VATREVSGFKIQDSRVEETRDSVMVVERDTIMETTTFTVDRNEVGDTLRLTQVTDRTRARDRDKIAKQTTKTVVKTDTVYVERRDSVVTNGKDGGGQSGGTALHSTLKLIFLIVISLIVLVIVLKFRRI